MKGTGEGARLYREEATDQAIQARITRGEDPAEGSSEGEHEQTDRTPRDKNRGDKGAIGLWKEHQMAIFEVRITDVTAKSYRDGSSDQNLLKGENLNKRKHFKACLEARRSFTPLVFITEGCMEKETQAAVRQLDAILSKKWDREYLAVYGYVRALLSLSLARFFSHLLRGEQ